MNKNSGNNIGNELNATLNKSIQNTDIPNLNKSHMNIPILVVRLIPIRTHY